MEPQTLQTITQALAVFSGAIIIFLIVAQKLLKGWRESSTESSVMTMMHRELERMAGHNTKLASELAKLQLEVVALNQELRKLTIENQQLHAEVATLTNEVTRLQALLAREGLRYDQSS
jgi:predicted nuclease with TOPRIM domain